MPKLTGQEQVRVSGRWTKGTSGNVRGRPRGSVNRATMIAQSLIDDQCEKLVKKAVQMALAGDTSAMRVVLERLVPPAKHRTIQFELPAVESVEDIPAATSAILAAVSRGEIVPSDAEAVVRMLEAYRRGAEAADIETRLSALEAIHALKDG